MIKHCCPHDNTTPNDSCIGNDQEFHDGFNSHRNTANIKKMIDIIDAFFHIKLSLGKKNRLAETPEEVFSPLVRMMTLKLHQSLDQDKQNRFVQIWTIKNSEQKGLIESYFPNISEMTDTELLSQKTIEHKNIQKKIKPETKNDRLLLESVKYVTMIDWTNAEDLRSCHYCQRTLPGLNWHN